MEFWFHLANVIYVFSYLVTTGQWRLAAPVRVRTRDYRATLT